MRTFISIATTAALLLTLGGCANRNKTPEPPKIVKSITLMPVLAPAKLTAQNNPPAFAALFGIVGAAIAHTASAESNKSKTAEFDTKYAEYRQTMGDKLTLAVQKALQAKGFVVELSKIPRPIHDKDGEIEYERFAGHNTLLEVTFADVGMYSGSMTAHYEPDVRVDVILSQLSDKEYLIRGRYYYGAYGGKINPADPKFKFPNFADLMNQPEAIRLSFDEGIQKLASNFANDVAQELVSMP